MNNKIVSLCDIIKLSHNPELSEPYIRYICGIGAEHQYRHQEIEDISALVKEIHLPEMMLSGFIYGYVVPQLNKEFDLVKISETTCLNIELKSGEVSDEKIKRQLLQNRHYLKLLNKSRLYLFTYFSSTNTVATLNDHDEVVKYDVTALKTVWSSIESAAEPKDLDQIFTPKNILVSPLNSTERFLNGDYLLTENQENIKKDALEYLATKSADRFIGITGGPGTGKTLLIYDIARELSHKYRILLVHSGILCDGHNELNQKLENVKIISAKELRLREINDVDIVVVDEAHRLYTDSLEKIDRWVKRSNTICVFSYDAGQMLSSSEKWRDTAGKIDALCANHIFRLTNKIRTNKELALFITCLRDLSKYRDEYSFPNVRIIFEPDKTKAVYLAESFEKSGYTYISYTGSFYNHELDYQRGEHNTHNVIGQEFEGVCMLLDDNLYYSTEGKLCGRTHPNPDYLFEQLLYQGLTRVRSKIALIVMSEELMKKILPLMKNN